MKSYKAWCGKSPEQIADARTNAIRKIKNGTIGHTIQVGKGGRTDNADTIRAKIILNSARCNVIFHELTERGEDYHTEEWRSLQNENDMLMRKVQELRVKEYMEKGVKPKWSGIRMEE